MPLIDYSYWDNYKNTLEAMSGGKNTVIFDDAKLPSVMVRLSPFNLEDIDAGLGSGLHPAFLYNSSLLSVWVGKYLATVPSGGTRAYSLPGNANRLVKHSVTYDQAVSFCTAKGTGWHLMTAHEWGAIGLWCCKENINPRGNTDYGRAYDAKEETAIREDTNVPGSTSGTSRTLSGTGPDTWTHDQLPTGIHDLVGNVWEWNHLLKIVDGRIICPTTNVYDLAEASWTTQDAYFNSPAAGDMSGSDNLGAPSLADSVTNYGGTPGSDSHYDYNSTNPWRSMTNNLSSTPSILRALLLAPTSTITNSLTGVIYVRNYGTRVPLRGGGWHGTSGAGLGALLLSSARSTAHTYFGFRPAYAI